MQNNIKNHPILNNDEITRYSRHILLPEVGIDGQEKLKAARILIIGAGGLGSPAALYLAAAGVGMLGIVEFDTVDRTNLQRQILYADRDVGNSKLQAAVQRLLALAPTLKIKSYEEPLSRENAEKIISDFDIVIDGTDNFKTRYLTNDVCVVLGKPYVYGSIFRFEGQTSVFDARVGPCYRCLFAEAPPLDEVPNCAEGGVLGVLPGLVGVMQATEAIKMILGIGSTLVGRLLLVDALSMRFQELQIAKDPQCRMCGPHSKIKTLQDIFQNDEAMDLKVNSSAVSPNVKELFVSELNHWKKKPLPHVLLDVRAQGEVEICRIDGSVNIPLQDLERRLGELNDALPIVVHCKSGSRSKRACHKLADMGFKNVYNLNGGIMAWIDEISPDLPKY